MPLVGHGYPVADIPHHESKCDLLGPHGSASQQAFASVENALLGPGMQEGLDNDTDSPEFISTECHTSKNNFFPSSSLPTLGSHHSLLISQHRHSLPERKLVSKTIVCQPRLIV
jgi:hypothetical protein